MTLARLAPGQRAVHGPAQAGELRYSVANIAAARRAFGFSPARSLPQDLDQVIAAVRESAHT
jgi:hypothetical protein